MNKITIAIFESLPDNETKTGKYLYDTILKYKSLEFENLKNEYFDIENKASFFDKLEETIKTASKDNIFYILHFEIHGHKDYLQLKNGDKIYWEDILPYFSILNIIYRNRLILHLAVCDGNAMIRKIDLTGRAPFAYMIGSFFQLKQEEVEKFEPYYSNIIDKIYNKTYSEKEMDDFFTSGKYSIISSEDLFNLAAELLAKDKQNLLILLEKIFPQQERNTNKYFQEIYEKLKIDIEKNYTINKNHFLMKDI